MSGEGIARSNGPSDRLGRYEILAKIGQGAMGEVHKARDTVLDRFVAIKTMSGAMLGDPDLGQRFLREAQSAARLNHPNVVTLHEFGEDSGRFFMAMELLEGQDLKDLLRRGALAALDEKLSVMEQILDGVAYAHGAGVVHRDLKPANIHVQPNGRVKVMDFGLARLGESELTRSGTVMGTPNYMSPEQVRGERAGPTSDVFSLGAVFYELIGGKRAFEADSMHAVLYKVTDADPVPLVEIWPELPPILGTFVAKSLAKEAELRYRDGREMRNALELCRRVLDGTLTEAEAVAELRQPATLVKPPDDNEATAHHLAPLTATPTLPLQRRTTTRPRSAPRLPTSVGRTAPTVAAPPPAPSRTPLYVGLGLVVVAGLVGGALLLGRSQAPAAAPAESPNRALVGVALDAQLEGARRSLEFKDLEGAITASGKALQLDPANAEAADLARRARAARDEAESFAAAARQAAQSGDLDAAATALARVTALMPKHPVVAELAPQLSNRPRPAAPPPPVAAVAPARTLPPPVAPPTTLAVAAAPATTLAPAPVTTVAAAAPPPPTTLAPRAVPNDDAAVRQLVASLGRAIEEKDLSLYRRLRPNLTAEDERRLKDAFQNVASQQVEYRIDAIAIDGDKASVRVTRTGRVSGQVVPPVRQVLQLVRADGGWVIAAIGQ